jgi:uncharacterized protein YggE
MKRFAILLMALVCMFSFACAEGTSTLTEWIQNDVTQPISEFFADETLITTVGTADATAEIDIATLVFSIEATGETVAEANQLATANIKTITDLLIAQGVDANAIWHRNYNVSPNVVYHNTKMTNEKVIDGYIVEIVLCVRLTDISLVGVVIDAAMQSGAGSTHELEFERSTAQNVYDEALKTAVDMAMDKAQHLADGCCMTLGGLVSVKELSSIDDGEAVVEVTYRAK